MTNDIAALIERWKRQSFIPHEDPRIISDTKDALSRLTTQPLPEDIAGFIKYLESGGPSEKAAATIIRALAQENERLNQGWKDANDSALDRGLEAAKRIAELEAENNSLRNSVDAVRTEYLQ